MATKCKKINEILTKLNETAIMNISSGKIATECV